MPWRQVAAGTGCFLCGVVLVLARQAMAHVAATREVQATLVTFLRLLPPFALGDGLMQVSPACMHASSRRCWYQ